MRQYLSVNDALNRIEFLGDCGVKLFKLYQTHGLPLYYGLKELLLKRIIEEDEQELVTKSFEYQITKHRKTGEMSKKRFSL